MRSFWVKGLICVVLCGVLKIKAEIVLDAGSVSYEPGTGIILADGDVRVIQHLNDNKTRELYAEKVEYNRKTRAIKLIGESIMKEPNGDIFSARNIVLEKDFKDAIADALVVVLHDSSKIKAMKGKKSSEFYTFENVSYTPCKETVCSSPLWDLAAEKAVYDKKKQKIIYKNVKLRIKGKPILFSPYFEHPSFDVKHKTGFLVPIIRRNSDIGFLAGFPFYIAISADKSLKLTPFLNSRRRAFASAEYRQLFSNADFSFSSSFLEKGKNKIKSEISPVEQKDTTAEKAKKENEEAKKRDKNSRWHIDTFIKSHGLDNADLMLRLNRSSDMTYKTKYPVEHIRGYKEYMSKKYNDSGIMMDLYDKDYFLITEGHVYQTEDKTTAPVVFPHINFNKRKDISWGTMIFDSDTLYLTRNEKKNNELAEKFFRTSNTVKWNASTICSPILCDFHSAIRTDTFSVSKTDTGKNITNTYPILENQLALSMPFESKLEMLGNHTLIWAPKVSLTSVQTSTKRIKIKQKEDSIFDNFGDLNLHSVNRIGGYDTIERGERVSVGMEGSVYNSERRWLNFYIGRSFAISNEWRKQFKNRDSFVGRFVFKPNEILSLRTRFVGFPILEKAHQFEAGVNAEYRKVSAGLSYFQDDRINCVEERGVSQLGVQCGYKFNEYWKISGSRLFNLLPHNGNKHNLVSSVFVSYTDECFGLEFGVYRTNFRHKDIKPKTGIILTIRFKNLGNFIHSGTRSSYNDDIEMVA